MNTERYQQAYRSWKEAAQKFDYFMAALSTALVAYLVPTLKPTSLQCNPDTLRLVAVLLLVGSVWAGLKRIESTVHAQRMEAERQTPLELAENPKSSTLVRREAALEILKDIIARAERWYLARDALLIGGFLLLIGAMVWDGYLPTPEDLPSPGAAPVG